MTEGRQRSVRTPASRPSGRKGAAAISKRRRDRQRWIGVACVAVLILLGVVVAVARSGGRGSTSIVGVRTFGGLSRNHVSTPVPYPQAPPVGGDHDPVPQTCGAYSRPIPNERGVHSMEHGAVWITYRPDLAQPDIDRLRAYADQGFVLISPYPGLLTPVVVSAWGRQLQLPSATDPRLGRFVHEFRQGPQTPEPGTQCTGSAATLGGDGS